MKTLNAILQRAFDSRFGLITDTFWPLQTSCEGRTLDNNEIRVRKIISRLMISLISNSQVRKWMIKFNFNSLPNDESKTSSTYNVSSSIVVDMFIALTFRSSQTAFFGIGHTLEMISNLKPWNKYTTHWLYKYFINSILQTVNIRVILRNVHTVLPSPAMFHLWGEG